MKNKINTALENYGKLIKIDEMVQCEEDMINVCILVAKLQTLLSNSNVDYIISQIDKNGHVDESYMNVKNIITDTLSNNSFYLELEGCKMKFKEFHLSSLDRFDDEETKIFWYNKTPLGDSITFDAKYLCLNSNIKFRITNKILKSNTVEIYFNYMDWEFDYLDRE